VIAPPVDYCKSKNWQPIGGFPLTMEDVPAKNITLPITLENDSASSSWSDVCGGESKAILEVGKAPGFIKLFKGGIM
jgi:hypothetical protein